MKPLIIILLLSISENSISQNLNDSLNVTINDTITEEPTIEIVRKFKYKNSVHLELMGSGSAYSINYERVLINGDRWKTAASIGLCYWGNRTWNGLVLPIGINEIFSLKNHHIVLGLGASPNYESSTVYGNSFEVFLSGRVGYRFQKPTGRLILGVYYTPIYMVEFGKLFSWGGISIGYAF